MYSSSCLKEHVSKLSSVTRTPTELSWLPGMCHGVHTHWTHACKTMRIINHNPLTPGRIPESLRNCVNKEFFVTSAPWSVIDQQAIHPELNGATYRWEGELTFLGREKEARKAQTWVVDVTWVLRLALPVYIVFCFQYLKSLEWMTSPGCFAGRSCFLKQYVCVTQTGFKPVTFLP